MWFQTPQYLRWSRMHLLKLEQRQKIISYIGIQPGHRVLDVGCGSGELTRYLAQGVGAEFVGIDIEQSLIAAAAGEKLPNTTFLQADALALPFDCESFDVVISHTFFTAVFEAEKAMEQMRRVCKRGGVIASITADSIRMLPHSPGVYPDYPWVEPFQRLRTKLDMAFHAQAQSSCVGVLPENMPRFFAREGLENVRVQPIEKFSSLSNLDQAEREEYLQLEYESELSRLELLPEQERRLYVQLLRSRKEDLARAENRIWEWSGGTNLLVTGINGTQRHALPESQLQIYKKAVSNPESVGIMPLRAHVASFATVTVKDGSGRDLLGVGATPALALESAYKKLLAREYTGRKGVFRPLEQVLQGNEALKKCLKQLNDQLEDTDAAYLQELQQWEQNPQLDEFIHPVTGAGVFLPRWLTRWCFGEEVCGVGLNPAQAKLESMYKLCAQIALKRIVTGQLTAPKLPEGVWKTVPNVWEAVAVLGRQGIQVTFFDASCGLGLPVLGALAMGNGGAKLRTWSAASPKEALEGCVAALLEDCTPDRFFRVSARITRQKPSHAQLYNVLTTGEDYLPASLLEGEPGWPVQDWCLPAEDPQAACAQLQQRFAALGWEVYGRLIQGPEVCVYQSIVPGPGMLYDFGSQRLLEYRLRKLAVPVLRNFAGADAQQQELAIKYVSMKRNWLRENTFSYLAATDRVVQLFDSELDARGLLCLYDVHTGRWESACGYLSGSSLTCRCLKGLLCGQSPQILAALYSREAVERALALQQKPLALLPWEN